jgi:hypothetical protein
VTQLSLTNTLVAGTTEDVGDVQQNFTDIASWSTSIDETNMPASSGLFAGYKTLYVASAASTSASTSGSYYFAGQGLVKSAASSGGVVSALYFDDADYTMSGKTQKLRVRAQAYTNATAPAITLTVGLYPISSVAGGAAVLVVTLGTVTAGSTVAFASPAASTKSQGNSGDFTIPADGHYVLGVALSGTQATNSLVGLSVQLQTRHV